MNPVVHFEMPAEDMERVKKFYTDVFGWKMIQYGADFGNYAVAQTDETDNKGMLKETNRINGGFYKKTPETTALHPSVVIAVDDLNAAMEKVKAAGGMISDNPIEIPTIGRYAAFIDTEGNRVGMLEPAEQM